MTVKARVKRVLKLRLTTGDHETLGHKLVSHWGQTNKDYNFNFKKYRIVEVCVGSLKGHCWIEELK